jgi:hypothetical protein
MLTPEEAGVFAATNFGPTAEMPTNTTVQILTPVELSARVTDDGRPQPPGVLRTTWMQLSGPATVDIPFPQEITNTVEFAQAGEYTFRLVADDGQVKVFQDLLVTVVEATQIMVVASDGEAAELGPDTGEFTFQRFGDLDFDMTIYFALGGTASNGVDIVVLDPPDSITLPAGEETVILRVTPFLDDRTEGDETMTVTLVTNAAYSIGSGEATVTIHDSPFGAWNVLHFTLEELTDPILSGLDADFDNDGRVNLAEYAADLDPKSVDSGRPLVTALESIPGSSSRRITFTYRRRLAPTDVQYTPYFSHDLATWRTGPGLIEELSVTDDGNALTETVKARLAAPYSTSTNTFITVGVRLMTTGP